MKLRFLHQAMFGAMLLFQFSICIGTEIPDANESSKYLDAVREFADNVLKYGRDTYGAKHTPLFVDGLNVHTREPVKWISPKGDVSSATETEEWILSNFASQQTLLRTLDGLTEITGDLKYRDVAMQAIKYAFENLRDSNGLLYWGEGTAYDALGDTPCGSTALESIKLHYPYYELIWRVDPEVTKKLIGTIWSAHVLDWSNLEIDRIGLRSEDIEEPWDHEYKGGPTIFESKRSWVMSNVITASSLIQAGATLNKLSGDQQPLIWSKRLAKRFVDARHSNTGISALTYGGNRWGDRFIEDMQGNSRDPNAAVFPWDLFQAPPRSHYYPENAQAQPWMALFLVGELLGEDGREFTQWAIEELTAWGKASYRKKDNCFVPMLTDGTSLEGYVWKNGPGQSTEYNKVRLYPADMSFFWAYSIAYGRTGDEFMWEMVRSIAFGNGLGDIGQTPMSGPVSQISTTCSHPYGVFGFLELYRKTNQRVYLEVARRIADNIVEDRFYKGFFVPSKKHFYTRVGCFEPLALLRLEAVMRCKSDVVPQPWPCLPLFVYGYRYKIQGVDRHVIYGFTESSEPPLSIEEAAAVGDVDSIKRLIEKGIKVEAFDSLSYMTALHRAAMEGHKSAAELLLAKGAPVNERDLELNTPLIYAVRNNHKEVVELLISTGADVNIKNRPGETPLDIALSRGRNTEIVKLLLDNGGAVTSLHKAVQLRDPAIVKAFLKQGADINAKDEEGMTPLHLAARKGHKDIVELLIEKGADVDAKNSEGKTAEDIANEWQIKLLIAVIVFSVPFVIGCILAIPLTFYLRIVADRPKRFFRYFIFLVAVFLLECAALAALLFFFSSYMLILWLALAIIWGIVIGIWLRRRSSTKRVLKGAIAFAVYMSMPAVCIGIGIIIAVMLNGGEHILDGTGMPFPLNTILGSALTLGLGTVLLKVFITTGEVTLLIYLRDKSLAGKAKGIAAATAIILAGVFCIYEIAELFRPKQMLVHDVGITKVSTPSTCVQGDLLPITVSVANKGGQREAFRVTLHDTASSVEIAGREMTVEPRRYKSANSADLTLCPPSSGPGNLGWGINVKGDVNRDGYDDLLIGASLWNEIHGRAYLYLGGADMDGVPDLIFEGEAAGDSFGDGGATLGDVNGDSYDDVIVGARGYNNNDGRLYIFFGGTDMDKKADVILDGEPGKTGYFSSNCLSVGDVDKDGYMDVLVGAWGYENKRGRVYLYYGGDPIDTSADIVFEGEHADDFFGRNATIGQDVDGDGYRDILVGARTAPRGTRNGRAYLFYGGTRNQMDAVCDMTFTPPSNRGHEFGSSLDIYDIDGDGYADVVIGARLGQGAVFVYWGNKRDEMDAVADVSILGEDGAQSSLGGDKLFCADFNGDGYGDIAVGAYNWRRQRRIGRTYVYYGGTKTSIDPQPDMILTGEKENDYFGHDIGGGDFNNDGYTDLVAGAWGYNNSEGRAYVFYAPFENKTDITFNWDTTNATPGKHTLKATIAPVAGEADVADNIVTVEVEVKDPS